METINQISDLLSSIQTEHPIIFYSFIFAYAASFATFLNVVIFRMPFIMDKEWCEDATAFLAHKGVKHDEIKPNNLMYSVIGGRSHCPICFDQIPLYYNIPILGWLMLKGKSACCKQPIPFRYIGFELLYTAGVLVIFTQFSIMQSVFLSLFLFVGLAIAAIDAKTTFIPDFLSYTLLWSGLIASTMGVFNTPIESIIGASGSFLFLYVIAKSYTMVRGIDGMGAGDFKLVAAIGAWTGIAAMPFTLLLACFTTFFLMIMSKTMLRTIPGMQNLQGAPFGPGLIISGLIMTIHQIL